GGPLAALPAQNLDKVKQARQQTEREYILAALRQANGRIRGEGGAAQLLNVSPTTLDYRIEKLGIRKAFTVHQPGS
ncbi:MAG TPA: helix-turn-helix domain-containing protein, partial [Cytophagales bacterium]